MKKWTLSCFIIILSGCFLINSICFAGETSPYETKRLSIATVDNRPLYIDRLLYAALKDIGYQLEITASASVQQGYSLANSGERDGVISSTPNMEERYPSLKQIPVILENNNILVFTRKGSEFLVNGWESLSELDVGILSERVYIQNNMPLNARVITKETTKLLMDGLAGNDFDAVVLSIRKHEKIALPENIVCAGQIETLPEYLYLNESHERLLPILNKAIDGVLSDGRGDKILNDIQAPELYGGKTILHIVSANQEIPRENAFNEKLRSGLYDGDAEWYTLNLSFRLFSGYGNMISYYAGILRQECLSRNISAIVVSGEDAFEFLKEYYNLFFKNVPVIYYGLDEEKAFEALEIMPYSTGIIDTLPVFETVSCALSLFPDTTNLFVLNDYSKEGLNYRNVIERELLRFNGLNVEFSENGSLSSILARINELPETTVVLAGSYFLDSDGRRYSFNETKKALAEECPFPVFTSYSGFLPFNAIGGMCLDYEKYGEIAAEMLKRIFNGESASDIPVIVGGSQISRWVFDKEKLDKWGIKESHLPYGSEIINEGDSVWETNTQFVYSIIALLAVGILVIAGLSVILIRYLKQNKDLIETRKTLHTAEEILAKDEKIREGKKRLENMINGAPEVAYLVSVDGIIVEANKYLREKTNIDVGDESARLYADPIQRERIVAILSERKQLTNEIVNINMADGQTNRCLVNMSATDYEGHPAIVVWAVDIELTERQRDELNEMHQRLSQVHERMSRVVNSAPVSYAMTVDGVLVELNESMKRNTGLRAGDYISSAYENPEEHKIVVERVLESGTLNNEFIRMRFADGSVHRCVANISAVDYDEKTALVAWLIDFEEDELIKDRIMYERGNLQAMLDSMPLPISITDIKTRKTVYGNDEFLKLIGTSSTDALRNLDSPEAAGMFSSEDMSGSELLTLLLSSTEPLSKEVRFGTFYGGAVDTRVLTRPIEYMGNKSVMAIMTDLTVEKQYMKAGKNLQNILDSLPIPVSVTDNRDFSVIYANKSCAELFGFTAPENMLGLIITDYMPELQCDEISTFGLIKKAHENKVTAEVKYIRADGADIEARLSTCQIDYMGREASLGIIIDLAPELEQRRMRESLQTVMDALPIPVRMLDIDTHTVVYVNKSLLEMFEYDTSDELVGQHISKLLPELQEDGAPTTDRIDLVFAAEQTSVFELDYVSKNGRRLNALLTACMVDFQGKRASLGIIKDLAAEKEQEQIRRSLQQIMDTMPIPVSIADCETLKIVYGNDAYLNLLGISPDIIGKLDMADTLARIQDDGHSAREIMSILMASGETGINEAQVKADGRTVDVRILTRNIIYKGRSSVIGIMTDLSAEKEYRAMQLNLQTALDMLPMPIRIVDVEDMTLLYANRSALDLFGVSSQEELSGHNALKYMPEYQPDGESTAAKIERLNRSIELASDEFACIKKDGTLFDALITSCIIDYNGRICSLATIYDLTAEKEYEKMLLNAAEREKEANQLKSRFLVNMSHEIRTPMNAIIGLTEIELRKEQQKGTKEIYKKISSSAKALLSIINDILDLSKIEADKIELVYEEFELEETLNSALLVASPRIADKNVEFMLNISADLPGYIIGDKSRLWQILKNFLDNSAKFTESGKIVLTAMVEKERSDTETVTIAFIVEDTGIGMTPEQLNTVFMPYEQFYSEAQKRYSGTGLGMPIAKQLCELMGGDISISSKRGVGTTIKSVIPFKRSEKTEMVISPQNGDVLSGKKFLVADDDELSLEIMSNIIKSNGASCTKAYSGLEAMRMVFERRDRNEFFDAILLDYIMDGLNGIETAKQIQMSLSNAPKLLLVTAHQKSLIKDEMEEGNISDIIEKPFIPSQFIQKISEVLGYNTESGEEGALNGFKNVNALICEDNILNQEVAVGMFKFFGIVPVVADSGRHALDILKRNKDFDIIFMDLQMPGINGYETAAEIRKDKDFDNVPIISLTADAMPEVLDRCLKIGMNDHLAKPIDFDGLYNSLVKWLPAEKRVSEKPHKSPVADDNYENEALRRFQGDWNLYEKALRRFAEELPDEWPSFEEMLGDIDKTLFTLHNLKGVAGNLSEKNLYKRISELEEAIRASNYDEELYAQFTKASAESKEKALGKAGYADNAGTESESGTAEEFMGLLEKLETALEDYDPVACVDIVDKMKKKQWPVQDEAALSHMLDLAVSYDFDGAAHELNLLRKSFV